MHSKPSQSKKSANFLASSLLSLTMVAFSGCGQPQEEAVSEMKVEPATVITVAKVAYGVYSAIKANRDEASQRQEMKKLSRKIDAAKEEIKSEINSLHASDLTSLANGYLDSMATGYRWFNESQTRNSRIMDGQDLMNRLENVFDRPDNEAALSVVPALNIVVPSIAVLMEIGEYDARDITALFVRLERLNRRALEDRFPARWHTKVSIPRCWWTDQGSFSTNLCQLKTEGGYERPGIGSNTRNYHIKEAAELMARTDPQFRATEAFQQSLEPLVTVTAPKVRSLNSYGMQPNGIGVYGMGNNQICDFVSEKQLTMHGGSISQASRQITPIALREVHRYTGWCKVKIPAGAFGIAHHSIYYYSNGQNAYCRFPDGANPGPVPVYDWDIRSSTDFAFHGNCQ